MTHITRVFNPESRTLTPVERRYAGQVGDSISTTLHFEYTQQRFLSEYTPYIQFSVYDESGCQLVFGPAPKDPSEGLQADLGDKAYFDGVEFQIPWSVTNRVRSARVDYQLFFIKAGVEFDGRNVAQLRSTEVVMSAIDSIALRPSITCDRRRPAPCDPPFSPTETEPNLLGWVTTWKDWGLIAPVTQDLIEPETPEIPDNPEILEDPEDQPPSEEQIPLADPPIIRLNFPTYSGKNDTSVVLSNVPVMIDGKIVPSQLPFGNTQNTIMLLKSEISDGKSIMYDANKDGFVEYNPAKVYRPCGTCTSEDLDTMAATKQTLAGVTLKSGDVFSLTDRRSYGKDEHGDDIWYEAGTNWVWSELEAWEPLIVSAIGVSIDQGPDGIVIDSKPLQKAAKTQDGLMTKDMVRELRGKQNTLAAGSNITIEDGIISASKGGHDTCIRTISPSDKAEGGYYVVDHGLNTYDILFQIRTTAIPVEHVQARVISPNMDTLWIYLGKDLAEGETLSISMLACDVTEQPSEPEEPLDIDVRQFSGTTTWIYKHSTKNPIFCQLYEISGNEITGDVIQNTDKFDHVIATTDARFDSGYMLVAKADIIEYFEEESTYSVDVTKHGYTADDRFLIEVFVDGMGLVMTQITQIDGIVTIEFGNDIRFSGYVLLRKATDMRRYSVEDETLLIIEHNLNRIVGAQLFVEGDLQYTDVDCNDPNVCKVGPVVGTGYLLIL